MNTLGTNQGKNEDDLQSDLHPQAIVSHIQTIRSSNLDDIYDNVTRVQEEITHYSPETSSGNQKKIRSVNQSQVRTENTPATIEADKNLLALRQLANFSNSLNFRKKHSRICRLSQALPTTMATFDGEIQNF